MESRHAHIALAACQLEEHTGGDGMLGDSLLGADAGESLGDVMAGDLRAQVRRLESENEILRAGAAGGGDSNGGGEEVTALQELLEDRNRVIRQYEEDIRSKVGDGTMEGVATWKKGSRPRGGGSGWIVRRGMRSPSLTDSRSLLHSDVLQATEIHTLEDRVEELEDELRTANDVNFDMKLKVRHVFCKGNESR